MEENYRQYCTDWEIPVSLVCTEENTGNSQCHQSADVTMRFRSLFKTTKICFNQDLFQFLNILCFSVSFVSYSDKIIGPSQLFIFQEMRYILKSKKFKTM